MCIYCQHIDDIIKKIGVHIYCMYVTLKLTADGYLPRGLHRGSVAVVGVAGDLAHLPGHVVDHRHHVTGHLAADWMTVDVERDRWHRGAHGDAEDGHRVALGDHVDRVDGRRLQNK